MSLRKHSMKVVIRFKDNKKEIAYISKKEEMEDFYVLHFINFKKLIPVKDIKCFKITEF